MLLHKWVLVGVVITFINGVAFGCNDFCDYGYGDNWGIGGYELDYSLTSVDIYSMPNQSGYGYDVGCSIGYCGDGGLMPYPSSFSPDSPWSNNPYSLPQIPMAPQTPPMAPPVGPFIPPSPMVPPSPAGPTLPTFPVYPTPPNFPPVVNQPPIYVPPYLPPSNPIFPNPGPTHYPTSRPRIQGQIPRGGF